MADAGYLIAQVKYIQARTFERLLHASGIEAFSGSQGAVLRSLYKEDGLSVTALCEQTGLYKTTLTGMLDRMEEKGLIFRAADMGDRRVTRIFLSGEAKAMSADFARLWDQMDALLFEGFCPEELRQLDAMLERMLHNLRQREQGGA